MSKSVSASLRQLLQKGGDALRGKRPSREDSVQAAKRLANMNRIDANRGFGDTKKDK